MTEDKRRADLLSKAQEAEEQIAKSSDRDVRASWQRIADCYRELAAFEVRKFEL